MSEPPFDCQLVLMSGNVRIDLPFVTRFQEANLPSSPHAWEGRFQADARNGKGLDELIPLLMRRFLQKPLPPATLFRYPVVGMVGHIYRYDAPMTLEWTTAPTIRFTAARRVCI